MIDPIRTAERSVVAELAYTAADGSVDATVVQPLVHDGAIVLALPFARRPLADALAAARAVVLVASDDRLVLRGWAPVAVAGRVRLEADLDGRWFADTLLDAELRKHPPARLLADSLMQRREHWWYLPRLLCRIEPLGGAQAVAARADPTTTGLLAWDAPTGLRATTVAAFDPTGDPVIVRALDGTAVSGAGDPACLLLHDFSVPDLEERSEYVVQGRLEGDRLVADRRRGSPRLPEPARLLARYRAARAFGRACRQEIARARADRAASPAPPS